MQNLEQALNHLKLFVNSKNAVQTHDHSSLKMKHCAFSPFQLFFFPFFVAYGVKDEGAELEVRTCERNSSWVAFGKKYFTEG